MAGVAGIEPTTTVLETVVIPFNYTPRYDIHYTGTYPDLQVKQLWYNDFKQHVL